MDEIPGMSAGADAMSAAGAATPRTAMDAVRFTVVSFYLLLVLTLLLLTRKVRVNVALLRALKRRVSRLRFWAPRHNLCNQTGQ
jgi:hypothetical protein